MVLYSIFQLIARKRPFGFAVWFAGVFTGLYRRHRRFMIAMISAILLHLAGTVILGPVDYNLTGFDIITHTMFGFFAREFIERADKERPFIHKIRKLMPRPIRKYVNPTSLAFFVCGCNAVQEEISNMIGGFLTPTVWTNLFDQIKDAITDTIGITISAKKDKIRSLFRSAEAEDAATTTAIDS